MNLHISDASHKVQSPISSPIQGLLPTDIPQETQYNCLATTLSNDKAVPNTPPARPGDSTYLLSPILELPTQVDNCIMTSPSTRPLSPRLGFSDLLPLYELQSQHTSISQAKMPKFIPTKDIVSTSSSEFIQHVINLHEQVALSGQPNYLGCRLPVPTKLNIALWRQLLAGYSDYQVCEFLEYGWPVNYTKSDLPQFHPTNHASAHRFFPHVDKHVITELQHGGTIGPFTHNPFSSPITMSPLQTVEKKGTTDRRVVMDLSFPQGSSVNDGIPKNSYCNSPYKLQYPSVDDLVRIIREKGQGCHLYKRDLSRAYRQLYIDPGDYNLLGFSWRNQLYIDIVEVFGLRSAALACQRTTNAVTFIYQNLGYNCVNFLDDFGGCDTPDRAMEAFEGLGQLLYDLGLTEAQHKAVPPAPTMVFLGILLSSLDFTMSIPTEKMQNLKSTLTHWLTKSHATKKQLQSLIGLLEHISCCVKPGRVFMNSILNTLRDFPRNVHRIKLGVSFMADVHWFAMFAEVYNGTSIMPELYFSEPDSVFACDASLTAAGGFYNGYYFHKLFPTSLARHHINALELLTVIVCAKLWGQHWGGQRITVYCDNLAAVTVINSSRSKDIFMQACIRELWFIAAKHSFEIRAAHISTTDNRIPDHLSRWHQSPVHKQKFFDLTINYDLQHVIVTDALFEFTYQWR